MNNENNELKCWYVSPMMWGVIAVLVAITGYTFWETIQDMIYRWDTKEEYSYGYIIPFITLFLVWQRKEQLATYEFQPTIWALPLIVCSGLIFFIGDISTTHTLSQYALVFIILSITYGFMGWQAFKLVAVPIIILFFMVPLPSFLYNTLSTELQLISSGIGVAVIRAFGISVYLEGNVIDLGSFKLQVVEACSGLRYLFPLMSLSFISAYLYGVETWKRVFVFLSSIPITVLMNSFRIGVIGILVEFYGIEQAEGFLHDFEGWIIFMACMCILFLEMAILTKIGSKKYKLSEVFVLEISEPLDPDCKMKPRKISYVHAVFVTMMILVMLSGLFATNREDTVVARDRFMDFPDTIENWKGRRDSLGPKVLEALHLDDYIISNYHNDINENVGLYMAYYNSQQAGESAHSPRACIPGGGWLIKSFSAVPIEGVEYNGEQLLTNRLLIKKGDSGQLVYYWFQQRGRIITSEYLVKLYLFWDALTMNRTDGALVRVTTAIKPGEDPAEADKRLSSFVRSTHSKLNNFIPNKNSN